MALLPLPKNLKVEDLVPQLEVFDQYIARNDARITQLEAYFTSVANERGARIAQLEETIRSYEDEVSVLKRAAKATRRRLRKMRR